MTRRAVCATLVGLLALTATAGCTGGSPSPPTPDHSSSGATSLWADRTAYTGDSSRVATLVKDVGFGEMASTYTLALQTEREPYGVTISVVGLDKAADTVDFTPQATLLLGLVENLDEVRVVAEGHTFTLTADEASRALGTDVKSLGRTEARLGEYLRSLND